MSGAVGIVKLANRAPFLVIGGDPDVASRLKERLDQHCEDNLAFRDLFMQRISLRASLPSPEQIDPSHRAFAVRYAHARVETACGQMDGIVLTEAARYGQIEGAVFGTQRLLAELTTR